MHQSKISKIQKVFESPVTDPFQLIRRLSIAHLLLIYSNDYYQLVEDHLKYVQSSDEWVNNKFLQPYFKFIIKCTTSKEIYLDCKTQILISADVLQMLFYTINMLRMLFKAVQKMSLLGRYYKQKHNNVLSSAIEIIALQAQKLYNTFRHYLSHILTHKKHYIKTAEDQIIIKEILIEELSYLNEQMKKLFLERYFYVLQKGIGVKLFIPQEQPHQQYKIITSLISSHAKTLRQKKQRQLENKLFPGGVVDWNFYEETLIQENRQNITCKYQKSTFQGLDERLITQSDQNEEVEPERQLQPCCKVEKSNSQKETNTSIIQIQGNQM